MKKFLLVKGVLFDFDGTLTRPGQIDFRQIRREIECPADRPILEFIHEISDPELREKYDNILLRHEDQAAENSGPNNGAEKLLRFLRELGIPAGIVTRNRLASVRRALENFKDTRPDDFSVIITRESRAQPKPHPESLWAAAEQMGVEIENILMIGDFVFDIQAGNRAGAATAFLTNGTEMPATDIPCDLVVENLSDLMDFLRYAVPLPNGKVPNDMLEEMLGGIALTDPAVIVGPGVGEDAAVVAVTGEDMVVLKSDPITFATETVGDYTILVNANDIATMGAKPRWLLTTLLFPPETNGSRIQHAVAQMDAVCRKWDIALCGGHTEITDAVTRPVTVGMMVGTTTRTKLVEKRNMAPGDQILMTKGAGVEGTAIIALEFTDRLRQAGMTDSEIDRCKAFLEKISILPEAEIAADCPGVTAMHDITEGGIATALQELSRAADCRIRIEIEKIRIYAETIMVCRIVGLDPMGLIGSGGLLISCRKDNFVKLGNSLRKAGIEFRHIGEATEKGIGIDAWRNGQPAPWPSFPADEITRLFS